MYFEKPVRKLQNSCGDWSKLQGGNEFTGLAEFALTDVITTSQNPGGTVSRNTRDCFKEQGAPFDPVFGFIYQCHSWFYGSLSGELIPRPVTPLTTF